jgi:hypothetical protein
MPTWLYPVLIASGAGLGLSLLGKIMPKSKLENIGSAWGAKVAMLVEALLLRWFDRKTEEQVEEGLFCTLAYGVIAFCNSFIMKIKLDNVEEKK